ncbi:MAG: ABC transporter ATP-binding protein [Planctomycetes bacterium]|nr:ABC transporter ATP-binding protein [Planctomycetota bacterium]
MPFDQTFPEDSERALRESAPGEPVHARVTADLDFHQRFAELRVAVTAARILVIHGERVLLSLPIANLTKAATDELYGSGRLTATTSDGERVLAYFTRNLVAEFAAIARVLNDLVAKRTPLLPDGLESPFCKRCAAPLPERGANCPLCVPRGRILLRILGLVRPYRGRAILMLVVTMIGVAVSMAPPLAYKHITDDVIVPGRLESLPLWIGVILAAVLSAMICRVIGNTLAVWLSGRVVTDLQDRLHEHLSRLRMSYHGKRDAGELVGRVMNDTSELQHFLKDGLPYLLVNALSLVAIAVILVILNPQLALIAFLPVPFLIGGGAWFWKRLIPLFHRRNARRGKLYSLLGESLRGVKVVKALSQEQRRAGEFARANDQLFAANLATDRTNFGFFEVLALVMQLGMIGVWWFGAKGVVASGGGGPTLGDISAFAGFMAMFYGPLQWFAAVLNWMTGAFAGAERVFNVLDQKTEEDVGRAPGATAPALPAPFAGRVEFRGVSFSYDRGKEVLKDISFVAEAGEMLGLVGRSGAGKSTIINLLCRFYDPDHGEILIDGVRLQDLPLEGYRRRIGIVMQDPFLFHGSILDNIRYGCPEASFAQIVAAAQAAHCHDFILEKEDGYDTLVGDGGAELSGGERQRLSIARAILHDPRILILDEATSAIDSQTEKAIQEAIARLIQGRTTIAIAHRLATLRNAHRLVVVDDGTVVEQGTHDELLAKPAGHFAKLVRLQGEINRLKAEVMEIA